MRSFFARDFGEFFCCSFRKRFAANGISYVRIETTEGNIDLEIDGFHAPITAANFIEYVLSGAYDGGVFQCTVRLDNQSLNPVKIEVIQAGTSESALERPAIPIESTSDTGIKHLTFTAPIRSFL